MSRRLIMMRHGETTYNATRRMQGQLDTQLSDAGISQAHAAAEWVKDMGIVKIVSSDLSRASTTAEIVGEKLGLEVELDPRLRETHLGQWQGMTHVEVDGSFVGARAAWRHDPSWAPPGGGESRLGVAERARPVVDKLLQWDGWDGAAVLFVAHGGTISALTSNLLGLDHAQYPLLKSLKNTNTSKLYARPRMGGDGTWNDVQWYLEAWNQGAS